MNHRSSSLSRLAPPALMAVVVIGFGACSGRSDSFVVDADAIPECEGYLSAYRACFSGAAESLNTRIEALRKNFLTVANRGEAARAHLRETCSSGTDRLRESCR